MLIYLAKMYSASPVSQALGLGDAARTRCAWFSLMGMTLCFSLWIWLRSRHLSHNQAAVPTLNSIWRLPGDFLTCCPGEWGWKIKAYLCPQFTSINDCPTAPPLCVCVWIWREVQSAGVKGQCSQRAVLGRKDFPSILLGWVAGSMK